jgi:hypothetical protein
VTSAREWPHEELPEYGPQLSKCLAALLFPKNALQTNPQLLVGACSVHRAAHFDLP